MNPKLRSFIIIIAVALAISYITITYNYFHILTEILVAMIGFTVAITTWNTSKVLRNQQLKLIGVSLLFFVALNLFHVVLYSPNQIFDSSQQYHYIGLLYISIVYFISLYYMRHREKLNLNNVFLVQTIIVTIIVYIISSTSTFDTTANSGDALLYRNVFIALIIFINIVNIIVLYITTKLKTPMSKEQGVALILIIFIGIFSYFKFPFSLELVHFTKLVMAILLYFIISEEGIKKPYLHALTELEKQKDELLHLNKIDVLTGLANRKYLIENLDKTFRFSKREKQTMVVIMVDIDDFSKYNIKFGHTVGDSILRRIAGSIKKECKRPLDFVGRYGGEEFIAVLPNSDFEAGRIISERIQNAIRALRIVHHKDQKEFLTVSIGYVSLSPTQETLLDYPLKEVDNQISKVKSLGKNAYLGKDLDKGEQQ